MRGIGSIAAALAVGAGLLQPAAAVPTVAVKGNAFFAGNSRFYIRGLDYQPGGSSKLVDPLADEDTCTRDIEKFTELGINTIRVYSVDNSKSHDTCMKALNDAGIYLILDVNSPLYSINRVDPHTSYNDVYLQSVFATVEMFSKYDNTLAFFSGNEVINETTASTVTAPYVKAVTRDIKQFLGNRQLRAIPVGYSAADVTSNRYETAEFMNCGTADERSDFFAFNDYSWCDQSSFKISGWDKKVELFSNYSIPIFLSEHGCNTNKRTFGDVASLYGEDMTAVYSGGLVYEYSQEESNYGLVSISGNKVTERPDFQALKKAYAATEPPTGDGGYKTDNKPSSCPGKSKTWLPENDDLPAIPVGAKKFMMEGAGKGPGLKGNDGAGSQNAGTPSETTATPGSGQPSTAATGGATSNPAAALIVPEYSSAPIAMTFVVLLGTLLGASIL